MLIRPSSAWGKDAKWLGILSIWNPWGLTTVCVQLDPTGMFIGGMKNPWGSFILSKEQADSIPYISNL